MCLGREKGVRGKKQRKRITMMERILPPLYVAQRHHLAAHPCKYCSLEHTVRRMRAVSQKVS
jgi:hypothetical protein